MHPIKIAILAMGGEGGGVLADWIVDLGEVNGFIAQTTSVPGVAQRTGATIYYVELFPKAASIATGKDPILALAPLPGDVDIVLASELMEAARSVQRGLVTEDRTTLIASTHRVYSIGEKSAMGDGRVDAAELLTHIRSAGRRFVGFDMAEEADRAGSVISAVLFGALAGTAILPFTREQFEATIERGGLGVKSSLTAFGRAFEKASNPEQQAKSSELVEKSTDRSAVHPEVRKLIARVETGFPVQAHHLILEGVRRLIDYQDVAYASTYLDLLEDTCLQRGASEAELIEMVARHLALWMSYEDTARVAALKTRSTRFDRVRDEVRVDDKQVLAINEYMHPRLQEICETLPEGIGRWLSQSRLPRSIVESLTKKGRVVQTSSLSGHLMLWAVANARRWRRSTLRFKEEMKQIHLWLLAIKAASAANTELAKEIAECQRLVKGYSDTHERGMRNFTAVMSAVKRAGICLQPTVLKELRTAALADEHGDQLRAALSRHSLG